MEGVHRGNSVGGSNPPLSAYVQMLCTLSLENPARSGRKQRYSDDGGAEDYLDFFYLCEGFNTLPQGLLYGRSFSCLTLHKTVQFIQVIIQNRTLGIALQTFI